MRDFIEQIIIIALPFILGHIVWLLQDQKKQQEKQKESNDANAKGTMLLLRAQLIKDHEQCSSKGYITTDGLDNFNEMYDAYHELGGNGMATKLKNEIEKLPIKGGR